MSKKPSSKVFAEIGKRIREHRTALGMTQEQLSDRADLAPETVSNIERAMTAASVEKLELIAKAMDLELIDLIPASTDRAKPTPTEDDRLITELLTVARRLDTRSLKVAVDQVRLLHRLQPPPAEELQGP
ncbi:helix-turn-helix domain-containing protein [Lacibacterium aquatile]|uniref:Helix-turn-helix domain-containing protein n=1 Tax=Lacibacterium aquatile TaxID=1168082 RepID=A0ABW5DVY2_9PROT